jgi:hypothetical protein
VVSSWAVSDDRFWPERGLPFALGHKTRRRTQSMPLTVSVGGRGGISANPLACCDIIIENGPIRAPSGTSTPLVRLSHRVDVIGRGRDGSRRIRSSKSPATLGFKGTRAADADVDAWD